MLGQTSASYPNRFWAFFIFPELPREQGEGASGTGHPRDAAWTTRGGPARLPSTAGGIMVEPGRHLSHQHQQLSVII